MSRIVHWNEAMGEALGPCVAALGVFDGVHIGHQSLIQDAVALAASKNVSSVAVTFDRDPDQIVTPLSAAPQLLDLDHKSRYLLDQGVDVVLIIPFTIELASTAPLVFLDEVLLTAMTPVAVVVGYDFRFGHHALGDVDLLVRHGADHGFTVVAHQLVQAGGSTVSSTRVRQLVASGDVSEAARLLGRPHMVIGEVVHGRGAGAGLDAPTANLLTDRFAALPRDGVYAGRVEIDGVMHPAAISVGAAPTFEEADDVLEVHVIDFEGDLYGRDLMVEFLDRLRDQRRFDDSDDLIEAIRADIVLARAISDARS